MIQATQGQAGPRENSEWQHGCRWPGGVTMHRQGWPGGMSKGDRGCGVGLVGVWLWVAGGVVMDRWGWALMWLSIGGRGFGSAHPNGLSAHPTETDQNEPIVTDLAEPFWDQPPVTEKL